MRHFSLSGLALVLLGLPLQAQAAGVQFTVRSAQSGKWSDPATWTPQRVPGTGDLVQVRPGHRVTYDVASEQAIRMLHVAGTLTFSRDRSTRLDVGLIKVQPGEEATEDGFLCDHCPVDPKTPMLALEIGTPDEPIPAHVTATIRLVHFEGTDQESLPAILVCRGRWDLHGAPMSRTWVKLAATAKAGSDRVVLAEAVSGWKVGDRVLLTASNNVRKLHQYRETLRGTQGRLQTEERLITRVDGPTLVLDKPLAHEHVGEDEYRSEVANLSRNVVVESAHPAGVRGHTMYHRDSSGGISYAEFRHLGKEGLLGKYPIHFHLAGDSMRGSGVVGASIWDSHNHWITIHGTDYLLVRDCVGYRSVGHGFFLEDATEQYNVLDRNLAVQAFASKPLPKQALPFDQNEGAGFWWANGRNTFTRNVACENDRYGFLFEITRQRDFDTVLPVRLPDGTLAKQDVRTIPFFRFQDNEVHSQRSYGFKFGDHHAGVRGDKQHPFIARNLLAWDTHYLIRPDVQFFLLDGFRGASGAYAIYQADYDHHVYRNITLTRIGNRAIGFAGRADGHGRGGIQEGPYTFEDVTLDNVQTRRHPLVCMNTSARRPGEVAHFRNIKLTGQTSGRSLVDIQSDRPGPAGASEHGPTYFFHDYPDRGQVLKVVGTRFPEQLKESAYAEVPGVTGPHVRAAEAKDVTFPTLLEPVDDLPPATMVTSPAAGARVRLKDGMLVIHGTTTDNGKTRRVRVNGVEAQSTNGTFRSWEVKLTGVKPGPLTITAGATDEAGNVEQLLHRLNVVVE
jgi:hypothetical protein